MQKVKTVAIVSLSSGVLGEDFVQHEVKIGLERLRRFGLEVKFMENALKGLDYLKEHPEKRAEDLLRAFSDDSVDMILCAIGGEDTYRLLPYLFEEGKLEKVVKKKIFLGFSDTTMNHLMLHKLGIKSFYGQAFLPDICELEEEMLPYSEKYFSELIQSGSIRSLEPSPIWYEERTDFGPKAIGTKRVSHENEGFLLLQGSPVFQGEILGGCIDTLYDIFDTTRHEETVALLSKLDVDKHIDVEIKLDELDLTSAESKASYAQIKEYILEKFDLKVSTLYIAQIKKKCGIVLREHYNKSKKEKQVIPQCTPEKEEAIMDALRHFKMI